MKVQLSTAQTECPKTIVLPVKTASSPEETSVCLQLAPLLAARPTTQATISSAKLANLGSRSTGTRPDASNVMHSCLDALLASPQESRIQKSSRNAQAVSAELLLLMETVILHALTSGLTGHELHLKQTAQSVQTVMGYMIERQMDQLLTHMQIGIA